MPTRTADNRISGRWKLRYALLGALLVVVLLTTLVTGAIGVSFIRQNLLREAQTRVNHDLGTLQILYRERLATTAERVGAAMRGIDLDSPSLAADLQQLRQKLGLSLLNLCSVEGKSLAGQYPDPAVRVRIDQDPVLAIARQGTPSWGSLRLDADRLATEGGTALQESLRISAQPGTPVVETDALFWWIAQPLFDGQGQVQALMYGGIALNHNSGLVDELRSRLFVEDLYAGRPLGTVTLFLDGVRVATNVRREDGSRAVGTMVSPQVRELVLKEGQIWQDRAWVVNAWYLAAYAPLRSPDGRIIGMLYLGLLEQPYADLTRRLVLSYMGTVALVGVVAILLGLLLLGYIVRPLSALDQAAIKIAEGDWEPRLETGSRFHEVDSLVKAFKRMQAAIVQRDQALRERNQSLAETNTQLHHANQNYMGMLGFVTHELKSPLAAIQTMIDAMLSVYQQQLPPKAQDFMRRIRRACEDLQDMVKNYLDLSRVESGDLVAHIGPIDLHDDVISPAIELNRPLLSSREIQLDYTGPTRLAIEGDAELLRIVLSNLLSNVAKYGRQGGAARLSVQIGPDRLQIHLWNEGQGFTKEEGARLFGKFSRLANTATRGTRGSGVGLYLCKQILEQHGGRVWATAEPGQWAQFSLEFPFGQDTQTEEIHQQRHG